MRLSDEDDWYSAVAIYQRHQPHGDLVAWIELLSPTNKPLGRHFDAYRAKRQMLLQAQLVFVEIDLLHESPPTVNVPSYVARRAGV